MAEIFTLLLLVVMSSLLFIAMGKYLRAHLIKESSVTAVYLLEGALDETEYRGECGTLSCGKTEQTIEVGGWQYRLTLEVTEIKPGLGEVLGEVAWQREKHHFLWKVKRKILLRGRGYIPPASDDPAAAAGDSAGHTAVP